jgi:hypothetical protein
MTPTTGLRIVAMFLAVLLVITGVWLALYPQDSDPKNIKYVLWKNGLYRMNLDMATGTMIGDNHRNELVLGKSEEDLRKRFGYLTLPADASPYLRNCYADLSWKGMKVMFIRSSPWMIVFRDDKAAELVLIKGC